MNLLILGGTKFVGRHITEVALAHGQTVTLFNRGKTNANLFAAVEKISGDRDGGLDALKGRDWDAVIDVNGYLPRLVGATAQLLVGHVAHYVYVSSLSVYAEVTTVGQTEDAPLATLADPTVETITGDTYGALKALCERAVQEAFPERNAIIRLGYVVGPYDHTDRFTSYLRRAAQGGEMIAPGGPESPVQFIDGRDAAAFVLKIVEMHAIGIYNVTGPGEGLTYGKMLNTAKEVSHADTKFEWADEKFQAEQGVEEGTFPMWLPSEYRGGLMFDNHRAIAAGLTFRPLSETIADTLAWDKLYGTPREGLSPEREQALLHAWHIQHGA